MIMVRYSKSNGVVGVVKSSFYLTQKLVRWPCPSCIPKQTQQHRAPCLLVGIFSWHLPRRGWKCTKTLYDLMCTIFSFVDFKIKVVIPTCFIGIQLKWIKNNLVKTWLYVCVCVWWPLSNAGCSRTPSSYGDLRIRHP